jgi:hypothetical protein
MCVILGFWLHPKMHTNSINADKMAEPKAKEIKGRQRNLKEENLQICS